MNHKTCTLSLLVIGALSIFPREGAIAFAQVSGPIPDHIERTGPAAPDPRLSMLSIEEVAKVRQLLDQAFPAALVGQTLPQKLRTGQTTVAVFMSSSCPHCAAEVPFLSKLDTVAGGKVAAVFFDKDDGARAFLEAKGWAKAPSTINASEMGTFRVRGTPTTVVADGGGKILQAYVGELKPEQEAELLKAVGAK